MAIAYSELPTGVHTMLNTSLAMCRSLLRNTSNFYPFAVIEVDGIVEPFFVDESYDETAEVPLIESLDQQIHYYTLDLPEANSLIMYIATVESESEELSDVLVADISLNDGTLHAFYFPVTYAADNVSIGAPFTLHAS